MDTLYDPGMHFDPPVLTGPTCGGVACSANTSAGRYLGVTPGCAQPRRYAIGFNQTVTAGATVSIVQRLQECFRPDKLVIPSNIGVDFLIQRILVGAQNQSVVAAGAISAAAFSEAAQENLLFFDLVKPGIDFTLEVTNTSAGDLNFNATFFGTTVEGPGR